MGQNLIKVEVDEAAAFDMLSILEIKSKKTENSNLQFINALNSIVLQLGLHKTNTVLESDLYKELLKANKLVFNYVDLLNDGYYIPGLIVHLANMRRYSIKTKIQKMYFSSGLSEEKI